ncbi:MAG: MerR family transcriptional regulator [Nitrospirae bacterium]|nr:MerR family transcriptional regulator [Nitrospirota bacterium]
MKPLALKPDKLFYKISEVSKLTGLESYVLRYWETEFPVLRPKKNRGGQRTYEPRDIEMVMQIKTMLYEEGFTIAGARKQLSRRAAKYERDLPTFLKSMKDQLQEIIKIIQTSEHKGKSVRQ